MNGSDLAFAIGLPPEQAVAHLRAKGLKVSAGWRSVAAAAHARAFTVAHVTRLDALEAIFQEHARAMRQGLTQQQFNDALIPRLQAKGWFAPMGEPVRVPDGTPPDPQTGELATRKRLTPQRLKTIFETNMQSSMMAARYRAFADNVDKRPWWQWVARQGGNRRPAHQAMHGRVFRHDDAMFQGLWPPCGYGCKCRLRARSNDDIQAEGITPDASTGTRTDRVTLPDGTVRERTFYQFKGGGSFAADAGFGANPARVQAADRLLVAKAPQVLGQARSEQELRKVFTAQRRLEDLRNFVSDARQARQPMGAQAAVGALDEAAALHLADAEMPAAQDAPVMLADTVAAGASLAVEDWAALPAVIAWGELRWDAAARTLVYVDRALVPSGERRWVRVAVRAGADGNDVIGAELATRRDIDALAPVRAAPSK